MWLRTRKNLCMLSRKAASDEAAKQKGRGESMRSPFKASVSRSAWLHSAYLHACAAVLRNDRQHGEGRLDAVLAPVLHELELAIGRHEADHLLLLVAPQVDRLMEGHVLHRTERPSDPPLQLPCDALVRIERSDDKAASVSRPC